MQNRKCTQWRMLVLVGLVSLIALVLAGGAKYLVSTTSALAIGNDSANLRAACTQNHSGPSFNSEVVIAQGEVACGNVTAFGGTVVIDGEVKGNVVTFNSQVVIGGKVDGNAEVFGGKLVMKNNADVLGSVDLYGAQWAPGTDINTGHFSDRTRSIGWLLPGSGWGFPIWLLLLLVGLGLLVNALLPEHLILVRAAIVNETGRSLLVGLLSVILAPPVLIVLIALILSIPLAIIVGLGLIAAWLLGMVAMGWLVGEFIMNKLAPEQKSRPAQIIVGLTALVLLGSLPYIGWLISIGAGVLGLGAVLLSRFGTRLFGQPRRPFPG